MIYAGRSQCKETFRHSTAPDRRPSTYTASSSRLRAGHVVLVLVFSMVERRRDLRGKHAFGVKLAGRYRDRCCQGGDRLYRRYRGFGMDKWRDGILSSFSHITCNRHKILSRTLKTALNDEMSLVHIYHITEASTWVLSRNRSSPLQGQIVYRTALDQYL